MRQQFGLALILPATFFLLGLFSSHATHFSSSSAHGCASPIPQPVSGSPLPAPSVPGKILINEVLTLPGSRWNCSEPANVYSTTNDSWIELFSPQNQPYNLYAAHATIDSGPGTTSYVSPSSTPTTDAWDTPHRIIITVIIIALAITLFWCWRLFISS